MEQQQDVQDEPGRLLRGRLHPVLHVRIHAELIRPGRRALLAGAAVALSACGSPSGTPQRLAQSSPPPACRALPASSVPQASGQLTDSDSGTFCLRTGRTVIVFLRAPAGGSPTWSPISVSDTTVLQGRAIGFLTLVRGVTAGYFAGAHLGVSTLSSQLAGGRRWTVTIVVGTS